MQRQSISSSLPATTGNPAPKDFLKDANADIFQLDSIVFSNVETVEWVKELEYTIGESFGEITKQTDKANDFTNRSAIKLPIGTKIFKTDTPVYIAIVNGSEIRYLEMLEGENLHLSIKKNGSASTNERRTVF